MITGDDSLLDDCNFGKYTVHDNILCHFFTYILNKKIPENPVYKQDIKSTLELDTREFKNWFQLVRGTKIKIL